MPNLINRNRETTKWFVPAAAAQAEDAIFEVDGLAAGTGHQSGQIDLGEAAVATIYQWAAFVQFATTPILGEVVDIYLKFAGNSGSATAHPDNDDGTTDGAVSAIDKLENLHHIGSIKVDEAAADIEMVRSGTVEIRARSVQVIFWNRAADALTTDVDENGFSFSPASDEIQD